MTALEELIKRRLGELDISLRTAASRAEGMTTTSTLSRLATGQHTGKITAKTIAGVALALSLSVDEVRAAAAKDTAPARWLELAEETARLPEHLLAPIIQLAEQAILDYRGEQADKIKNARPFG